MTSVQAGAAGDTLPVGCTVIELRVAELLKLFNSIDPAPFRERDLDPAVEELIVDWSREVAMMPPLALLVRVDRPATFADDAGVVRDAIHEFFAQRAIAARRRLRRLFRVVASACSSGSP